MALAAQPFSNTSAKTSCKLRSAQNVKYNSVNRSRASSRTLERSAVWIDSKMFSEHEARSEFSCLASQKSKYARPNPTRPDPIQPDPTQLNPTQPDPVTLLRSLYLWNRLTDSQAVFFVWCHHSMYFVFDRHRYPPVPATARDTCRVNPISGRLLATPITGRGGGVV